MGCLKARAAALAAPAARAYARLAARYAVAEALSKRRVGLRRLGRLHHGKRLRKAISVGTLDGAPLLGGRRAAALAARPGRSLERTFS